MEHCGADPVFPNDKNPGRTPQSLKFTTWHLDFRQVERSAIRLLVPRPPPWVRRHGLFLSASRLKLLVSSTSETSSMRTSDHGMVTGCQGQGIPKSRVPLEIFDAGTVGGLSSIPGNQLLILPRQPHSAPRSAPRAPRSAPLGALLRCLGWTTKTRGALPSTRDQPRRTGTELHRIGRVDCGHQIERTSPKHVRSLSSIYFLGTRVIVYYKFADVSKFIKKEDKHYAAREQNRDMHYPAL